MQTGSQAKVRLYVKRTAKAVAPHVSSASHFEGRDCVCPQLSPFRAQLVASFSPTVGALDVRLPILQDDENVAAGAQHGAGQDRQ